MKPVNQVVQDLYNINITGVAIPRSWRLHIRKITNRSNKPYEQAINILSHVCFQYEGIESRDYSGAPILCQKFDGDAYAMSYREIESTLEYSADVAREAIKYLVKSGLLVQEIIDVVVLKNGTKLSNVMYLIPVPSEIQKITYFPSKLHL